VSVTLSTGAALRAKPPRLAPPVTREKKPQESGANKGAVL
jgi:hypothetical protein